MMLTNPDKYKTALAYAAQYSASVVMAKASGAFASAFSVDFNCGAAVQSCVKLTYP